MKYIILKITNIMNIAEVYCLVALGHRISKQSAET